MVRTSIIVYAGLIAGVLDIAAAMTSSVLSGRSPIVLLQFISSAIFGNRAFSGGLPMAALGLLLHFAIALTWAAVFAFGYARWRIIGQHPIPAGLAYGAFVWLVMNLVVLPQTNIRHVAASTSRLVWGIAFIVFLVGLPISLVVHSGQQRIPSADEDAHK